MFIYDVFELLYDRDASSLLYMNIYFRNVDLLKTKLFQVNQLGKFFFTSLLNASCTEADGLILPKLMACQLENRAVTVFKCSG